MYRLFVLAAVLFCSSLANSASAESIRLTIYDDGLSCPAGCDAHVVFHPTLNGTEFAHDPGTTTKPFAKCTPGQTCQICLESGGEQCLEVMYRGGGPAPKTFDLTPRFYQSACARTPSQSRLAMKCQELKKAASGLEGRRNCIAEPDHAACKDMIKAATARRTEDRVEFERCLAQGEKNYNMGKPIEQQRSLKCAYEQKGTGGPNTKGTTWRRLLPGVCRDGTYVGRDGLDCCSGITLADGPLGRECNSFYPNPGN
ncbi:MAG: hypothetical protein JWL63_2101 [Rhodocyclales bacterium]|nr:hypothetical protein [Rhodocyclales bacterium]